MVVLHVHLVHVQHSGLCLALVLNSPGTGSQGVATPDRNEGDTSILQSDGLLLELFHLDHMIEGLADSRKEGESVKTGVALLVATVDN